MRWIWKACRSWLMVAAVAVERSAYSEPLGSRYAGALPACASHTPVPDVVKPVALISGAPVAWPRTRAPGVFAAVFARTGADWPRGSVTATPFCGQGRAEVK